MEYANLKPIRKMVLLEVRQYYHERTPAGLYITRQADKYIDGSFNCTVRAVGDDVTVVEPGDDIILTKRLGIQSANMLLVDEDDLDAVVEKG